MHIQQRLFFYVYTTLLLLLLFPGSGYALSLIRDTEIESSLRHIANPLLKEAGLTPENVDIYIVKDDTVNAFVSGGMNIFFNTGLITLSTKPDMLIGVLAHEIGHITGGHLVRSNEQIKNAQITSALSSILGVGAIALGAQEAGTAIIAGGAHVSERNFLKHTRENEQAADQSALDLLDQLHYSANGLYQLMKYLEREHNIRYGKLNPYTITHPLSRERISHIQYHLDHSPYTHTSFPNYIRNHFARSSVKLAAFLASPEETLAKYPESDTSDIAYYARAIAYYKIPELNKSLAAINHLINKHKKDPYYIETKGQILFENGKLEDSIEAYQQAHALLPKAPLIHIQLARALIASDSKPHIKQAIQLLEQAVVKERQNSFAWKQLAIAYGRNNELGLSNLALAEHATLSKKRKEAKQFITEARKYLKKDSPAYIRTYDIINTLEKEKKDDE